MAKLKQTTPANTDTERNLDRLFWLWLAAAFSAVLIVAVIVVAWAVRHAMSNGARLSLSQAQFVLSVAEFPGLVPKAFREFVQNFDPAPTQLLIDRKASERSQWIRRFPAPEDAGYFLFSGVDPVARQAIIKLIRISDGSSIAQWTPNWELIFTRITSKKFGDKGNVRNLQAIHPLLLDDGDIIFNTNNSLVRLTPCDSKPVWVLDEIMHHSNELDASGTIWTPSVSLDGFTENPLLQGQLRDDALARISIDGRLLERHSFSRILRENGLQSLLLAAGAPEHDPIHMNHIRPASQDSRYWKRGDLLISARSLSSVFLFRPSTGRIIWHQQGPWMNQHSVDFVGDHQISVFDNNIVRGMPDNHEFVVPGDTNRVFLYDFETKRASQPFATLLAQARPITVSGGQALILPDGGLFVEESNFGRHLRFTKNRLLWSRVNDYDDRRIGAVSWSRYLTAEKAHTPLQALAVRQCQK